MSEQEQAPTEGTEQEKVELTPLEKLNADFALLVPGDLSKTVEYIVDHPSEYGFVWGFEAVKGRKVKTDDLVELRKDAPRIWLKPETVLLFVKTWGPELLAKQAKGTSFDVASEAIARNTLLSNRSTTNRQLQIKMVTSILLEITVRTGFVKIVNNFVANDGTVFADAMAAAKYNANLVAIKAAETALTSQAEFMAEVIDREFDRERATLLLAAGLSIESVRTILENNL